MIFVYLFYKWHDELNTNVLHMKTFTLEQKEQALQWHREHPEAVGIIGSTPMPEGYELGVLGEENK